jgi:ubiquitin-protein ligase
MAAAAGPAAKKGAARIKMLIENYVEARKAGSLSGYDIRPVEPDNYEHFYILIQPKTGVYKGHSYVMELKTTYGHGADVESYPIAPPYAHFITDVFHTNISPNGGSICVDILKQRAQWMPTYSFDLIVQNILLLFDEPNNASPYNGEASRLWVDCEKKYKDGKTALGGKKAEFKALEELHEQCFAPFSARARETMKKNNMREYFKYFPQLDPNPNVDAVATELAEFESLAEGLAKKHVKPEEKKDSSEGDKPKEAPKEDKSARWKKYQKK